MANRIFVCFVLALWLGSMSWLMVDKVLPSFLNTLSTQRIRGTRVLLVK